MPDVKEQVNRAELAFVEHELQFDHAEALESPMLVLNFGGGELAFTHVAIHLVFDPDGESAQIVTSPIASAPAEKTSRLLLTLNNFNNQYRWVKFYLDEDNDIVADTDVFFDEHNVGDVCVEIIMYLVNIINEAYPDIMKDIWS